MTLQQLYHAAPADEGKDTEPRDACDEGNQPIDPEAKVGRASMHRWLVAAVALVAVAPALALLASAGTWHPVPLAGDVGADTMLMAADNDPCKDYPFIRLDEVIHNNLGQQGPDGKKDKPEGIVYKATDYIPGKDPVELIITLNASDTFKSAYPEYNGIHGRFGLVTTGANTQADYTFKFFDAKTMAPKKLKKQEISFFDFDQFRDGQNAEYIEIGGFSDAWLTENTELKKTDMEDGRTKFISSTQGDQKDNPNDPLKLTAQQKNRAVTFEFEDFSEITVTLGNTEGISVRYFSFVFRPSLLCAVDLGGKKTTAVSVFAHPTTTTAPAATTTPAPATTTTPAPAEKKECLFVIPLINWCFPKFWLWLKFW